MKPGDVLGGFTLIEPLGHGGFGVVYLAEDMALGRKVAVKVLPEHLAADPSFRARFERESRLVASLDHPHIVPVFTAGEEGGRLYIAMR